MLNWTGLSLEKLLLHSWTKKKIRDHYEMTIPIQNTFNMTSGTTRGYSKFISHSELESKPYLKDDTLYFRVSVEVADSKPWLECTAHWTLHWLTYKHCTTVLLDYAGLLPWKRASPDIHAHALTEPHPSPTHPCIRGGWTQLTFEWPLALMSSKNCIPVWVKWALWRTATGKRSLSLQLEGYLLYISAGKFKAKYHR